MINILNFHLSSYFDFTNNALLLARILTSIYGYFPLKSYF